MKIGKKIKHLRCKASLTQEQLANRLGVSAQAVSKWENAVTMPDISLLPSIAEIFGISIDELFDLTVEQKFRRMESRLEDETDLDMDVFREYEAFLKDQCGSEANRQRAVGLLAHLYHHCMDSLSAKVSLYAKEAILNAPEKKDCQWLLDKAEGAAPWDWNIANHSRVIDFYKQVIENDSIEPKTPLPYYYLIDNLIADRRTAEAKRYLEQFARLPAHKPFMVPVYKAAIALAEFNEAKADSIIEKALTDFPDESGLLFEAAQYYAKKCDYDKAIAYYEASFAAEENCKPRFTDALDGIATIYEILHDYRKAAETRRRVLSLLKDEWGYTEETVICKAEEEVERLLHKAGLTAL